MWWIGVSVNTLNVSLPGRPCGTWRRAPRIVTNLSVKYSNAMSLLTLH